MPVLGAYSGSKHALVTIAGPLRMELGDQGIYVCLIEPDPIQSEIWRKGDEVASTIQHDAPARQFYDRHIVAVVKISRDSAKNALPAERMAALVYKCMTAPNPPARKVVGRDAHFAAALKWILPEKWFDAVLRQMLKLG